MKSGYVAGSTEYCHICGLKIPDGIVSPAHHLFGTVDHVQPRSRGGGNGLQNRLPAHNICNRLKADRDYIDAGFRLNLQEAVRQQLRRYPEHKAWANARHTAEARRRIGSYPERTQSHFALMEWESEGGYCLWAQQGVQHCREPQP